MLCFNFYIAFYASLWPSPITESSGKKYCFRGVELDYPTLIISL